MASMIAGIASMGSTIRLPRVADVDPDLQSDHGQALRLLLHLFEREEAAKLVRAG